MSFNENSSRPTDARKLATLLENEKKQALIVIAEIDELSDDKYVTYAKENLKKVTEDIKHIKETIDRMLDTSYTTHGSLFDPIACIRESFDNGIWNLNSTYHKLVLGCYHPKLFDVNEDTAKVLAALNLDKEKIPKLNAKVVELTKLKFELREYDIETIKNAESKL